MDYETLLYLSIALFSITYTIKTIVYMRIEREEFKYFKKICKPSMKYLKKFYKQLENLED